MADLSGNMSNINAACFRPPLEAVTAGFQVCLVVLYSLTSLVAFIGNITVIIVEIFGKQSANNLRKFLVNLAISDIIIGVLCVPFTYTDFMLGEWIFAHWLCPVAQFTQLLSVFVTATTLTLIGVERYLATIHPFSSLYEWLIYHCNTMLVMAWIMGSAFASAWMPHTGVTEFRLANQTHYDCRYNIELSPLKRKIYMSVNFVLTFALPLIVLALSYLAISRKLLADSMSAKDAPLRRNTHIKNRKKPIKMMFAVVLLYGICWMPIKMYQIIMDCFPSLFKFCQPFTYYLIVAIYFLCHWMAMANSFVNPIVYSFMSKSFRNDFKRITHTLAEKRRPFLNSAKIKTQTSTV